MAKKPHPVDGFLHTPARVDVAGMLHTRYSGPFLLSAFRRGALCPFPRLVASAGFGISSTLSSAPNKELAISSSPAFVEGWLKESLADQSSSLKEGIE